jgi:hypothetical protein
MRPDTRYALPNLIKKTKITQKVTTQEEISFNKNLIIQILNIKYYPIMCLTLGELETQYKIMFFEKNSENKPDFFKEPPFEIKEEDLIKKLLDFLSTFYPDIELPYKNIHLEKDKNYIEYRLDLFGTENVRLCWGYQNTKAPRIYETIYRK